MFGYSRAAYFEFGALEGAKQNLERLGEFTEVGSVIS